MMDGKCSSIDLARRDLLRRGAFVGTIVGVGASGLASASTTDRRTRRGSSSGNAVGESSETKIVIEQNGTELVTVTPLQRDGQDVVDFYSYGDPANASANTGLERDQTSNLFFYEDPGDGTLSLVIIHDEPDRGYHRNAEFDFDPPLPSAGSWAVKDDPGHRLDTFERDRATWDWGRCCTDGGAYRGGFESGVEIGIDPSFSGITTWRVLSGDPDDPERTIPESRISWRGSNNLRRR